MTKQDLGDVIIKTIIDAYYKGLKSASGLSKISAAAFQTKKDISTLMENYFKTSDFSLIQTKNKEILKIKNKKYKMISLGTEYKIPYVNYFNLKHMPKDELELKIDIGNSWIKYHTVAAYLQRDVTGKYSFHHFQYIGFRFIP